MKIRFGWVKRLIAYCMHITLHHKIQTGDKEKERVSKSCVLYTEDTKPGVEFKAKQNFVDVDWRIADLKL